MKFFALLLTAFMIFQQVWPSRAADVVGSFRGQPGYVSIDEMFEYYVIVCMWFMFGTALLYGSLWLNNFLVQSQMLSVLDHVKFSSENSGLYATMISLWAAMMGFFAVRIDVIIIAVKVWFLLGLVLAWKRVRWIGLFSTSYVIGYVFSQFVIIFTCVSVITYIDANNTGWFGSNFLYLGMFLLVISEGLFFVFWPLILKVLSPKSYQTILTVARYM
jgi:hypothetical protein